jgi:hypothetical protein
LTALLEARVFVVYYSSMSSESSPGAIYPPLPAEDPYAHTLIQFGVLRHLGYPVDIKSLTVDQARQELGSLQDSIVTPWLNYQCERYRRWARPVILDSDFNGWIDRGVDLYESQPDLRLSEQAALNNHPATRLPYCVDAGFYPGVRDYLAQIRQQRPVMAHPGNYGGVFWSCYVTAMDRFKEQYEVAPRMVGYILELAKPSDAMLYARLKEQGVRPVPSEAIGAMINDFYVMLGRLVPDFDVFRGAAK